VLIFSAKHTVDGRNPACTKPCKWDKLPTSTGAGFLSINSSEESPDVSPCFNLAWMACQKASSSKMKAYLWDASIEGPTFKIIKDPPKIQHVVLFLFKVKELLIPTPLPFSGEKNTPYWQF